jgi:hypothetical protein
MDTSSGNIRVPKNHHFCERQLIKLVESGEFEIDEQGRIWRMKKRSGFKGGGSVLLDVERRRAEYQLDPPDGYLYVRALIDGRRYNAFAHRLVWHHFKGPIPDGLTVNHEDGIKWRNDPDNLCLATYSEQMKHAYRIGLSSEWGERNPAAKLSNAEVEEIRSLYASGKFLQIELAVKFGVRFQQISRIVRGERRPKEQGTTSTSDHRFPSARDQQTGRFGGHSA